ncbi:aminotransferase class I/II-fold pyridoxal phosphate-dependent enzyme [Actinoplanes derwentensis]|uniref:8-amino-7-oxononanoate synthase n=1 Tax=Actinoplanes derwentensis TaxID=113562 RepID=A0A1H1UDA3_9ACTN|nr:pyridoxal phosphate-dependent aminotransferase family protein [Actinoplanes derwentensis]GID85267.1 2-amino-3-ketobutyrate CoA ligase [Actinoplanes derwentensis]SDS70196.1 8-amino-7-oxononanoate synthase [Actinoplanes derwentensis]
MITDAHERWEHSPANQGVIGLQRAGLWDQVIEEIDGRRIRIGDRWLVDFASCNYLGFDLESEIAAAATEQISRWGTHPSWSRMLGSPRLYPAIEERLTGLLGAPAALVLPTISQIHLAAIPALAGDGLIFLDQRAHKTVYDGCVHARATGATVQRFRSNDFDHLAELLHEAPGQVTKLVCMDGVNSMTGNTPDLARFAALCRTHDASLYIDDAHGFGVLGEQPTASSPYGIRGNAVVRHHDVGYDNIVLVGGFSKAYSSMLAFIACSPGVKRKLKVTMPTYLYSGPVPVASLATVLAGFDVNDDRGDDIRADLHRKTARVLDHLRVLRAATPNHSGFPLIEVPVADPADLHEVGRRLLEQGVYTTLAPYPGVPRDQVGFRIQMTAANTDEQVDLLLDVLTRLNDDPPGEGPAFRRVSQPDTSNVQ